jgi:RNA polymerase sigma-70 factor (ECF subfamily)
MNYTDKNEEFLELFERHRRSLSNYALALTRDRENAKDLVSETILIAYESFDKIRNKEAFKSYLFTIASRLYRKRNWRNRIFGAFNSDYAENIEDASNKSDSLAENDRLYAAIKELPEKQAEALILFEISDLSIEEIREIQGGTISGVKTRLKRGREKLKTILENDIKIYQNCQNLVAAEIK